MLDVNGKEVQKDGEVEEAGERLPRAIQGVELSAARAIQGEPRIYMFVGSASSR